MKALEKYLYTHVYDSVSVKPVAEFKAGLGVQPAVPGVGGALTDVTRVLRSKRKESSLELENSYCH